MYNCMRNNNEIVHSLRWRDLDLNEDSISVVGFRGCWKAISPIIGPTPINGHLQEDTDSGINRFTVTSFKGASGLSTVKRAATQGNT